MDNEKTVGCQRGRIGDRGKRRFFHGSGDKVSRQEKQVKERRKGDRPQGTGRRGDDSEAARTGAKEEERQAGSKAACTQRERNFLEVRQGLREGV